MKIMPVLKRVSLLLFALVIAFSFCSCKGSKLEGRWAAQDKVAFDKGRLDTEQYTFLEKTTCNYSLVLEDGMYTLSMSVPKEQRKKAVEEYKDLFLNYYKIKHDDSEIKAIMKETNCTTEEQLVNGLLLAAAQKSGYSSIEDYICTKLGIATKVLGSGKYECSGEEIKLFSSNNEEIVLYTATYANSKISLNYNDSTIVFLPDSMDN